ncbi:MULTISPECIES: hypothetical protein [unclassified Bradyrhizobium]|uniref:hypothetical protein n=1 Tax=Bradyrhizobium sp. USDA 4541 TaxID=2817704 RepID=UPI0020A50F54|nr:hypothetical protein [Bradyrhizobium sp. USDA 4541]MCP1846808.1 hypothetical protein [Bradyrhizobium sp. USDA 4541]
MRVGLICLIVVIVCVTAVGAVPKLADEGIPPRTRDQKAQTETVITRPIVPPDELIDQTPDGSLVIELYQLVRNIGDVEAVNDHVKAQVNKAQSVAADVARLHDSILKSCDGSDSPKIEVIALKARAFSAILARVDGELTKALAATRQLVEAERPGSIKAKEDINRFVLAAHELGRLRVQATEIAKALEGLSVSIRTTLTSCTATPVAPLFAMRDVLPLGGQARQSPFVKQKRATKPATMLNRHSLRQQPL